MKVIFIKDLKKDSDLIFDTHLMIEKPERMIESFIDAGSDIITVHAEATNHLERCLSMIKKAGEEVALCRRSAATNVENSMIMTRMGSAQNAAHLTSHPAVQQLARMAP